MRVVATLRRDDDSYRHCEGGCGRCDDPPDRATAGSSARAYRLTALGGLVSLEWRLSLTAVHGGEREHLPPSRHALQLVCREVAESEAGSGNEFLRRAGGEDLPGTREGHHAGADHHSDPLRLAVLGFRLAGVDPRSDLDPQLADL